MTEVLWVTPGYPWDAHPADGIFYRTQARAVSRLGVELAVVSPTPWAPWPFSAARRRWRLHAAAPSLALDEGVLVVRPRYPNVPGAPGWAHPDRMMADAVWRSRADWADAKFIHGHSALTGLAAWRVARRAGVPFALTFHGSDMNLWPDKNRHRIGDLRTAVREAAFVIAVSRALADRVYEVTGTRAVALPLGSDHRAIARTAIPRAVARDTLGLPAGAIVVLFVGHLVPAKGVRELATAILQLGEPFLGVFVGDGPLYGFGRDDPRSAGVLAYRGARPHEDVLHYMSAADVLVLPSHREGLPTVLVEAGSLGLPVVASAVGGIPELLAPDRGTLLADLSHEAISTALTAFVREREAAEAAALRLREHVLSSYDAARNAAILVEHYRSSVDRFPGGDR